MTATDRHLTLADLADELCDPHQHVERVPGWDHNRNRKWTVHKVTLPGLLQQMADLMLHSGDPDAAHGVPASRPPGNWAALSDHTVITLAAAKWCWDLRLDQRDTVEANIRQLVGASGGLDSTTRAQLTRDMARWHRIAELLTGWQTSPAEVRAPCPALIETDDGTQQCKARTLRVNLAASEAYCGTCGTTWDRTTIGLLAETVRAYNKAAQAESDLAKARARADRAKNRRDTAA